MVGEIISMMGSMMGYASIPALIILGILIYLYVKHEANKERMPLWQ